MANWNNEPSVCRIPLRFTLKFEYKYNLNFPTQMMKTLNVFITEVVWPGVPSARLCPIIFVAPPRARVGEGKSQIAPY